MVVAVVKAVVMTVAVMEAAVWAVVAMAAVAKEASAAMMAKEAVDREAPQVVVVTAVDQAAAHRNWLEFRSRR